MSGQYYYEFHCGTHRFTRWGLDDVKARRLLARWIRLAWKQPDQELYPMTAGIARTWSSLPGFVPYKGSVVIECFELSADPVVEFLRIAK